MPTTFSTSRLWPLAILAILAGCHNSTPDDYGKGPIDDGLYESAVAVNNERLAGEDYHRPFYVAPFRAMGETIAHDWDYITKDDSAHAVRKMLDPDSPDRRRQGILRMADFAFARKGDSLKLYAHLADDQDYLVRVAALRALNRSRARGYNTLFLKNLADVNVMVRLEAADALGNIPDPDSITDLLEHLHYDPSSDVRIACADALRNFRNREVAQALVDVLGDRDFGVSWQARQSLALLTGEDYRYDQQAWLDYISSSKAFG